MLVLAQALVSQPRFVLIDELSLGLAPVIVKRLVPTIRTVAESGVGRAAHRAVRDGRARAGEPRARDGSRAHPVLRARERAQGAARAAAVLVPAAAEAPAHPPRGSRPDRPAPGATRLASCRALLEQEGGELPHTDDQARNGTPNGDAERWRLAGRARCPRASPPGRTSSTTTHLAFDVQRDVPHARRVPGHGHAPALRRARARRLRRVAVPRRPQPRGHGRPPRGDRRVPVRPQGRRARPREPPRDRADGGRRRALGRPAADAGRGRRAVRQADADLPARAGARGLPAAGRPQGAAADGPQRRRRAARPLPQRARGRAARPRPRPQVAAADAALELLRAAVEPGGPDEPRRAPRGACAPRCAATSGRTCATRSSTPRRSPAPTRSRSARCTRCSRTPASRSRAWSAASGSRAATRTSSLPSGGSVTEIAFRWGFRDAAHFSRVFKREFEVTPSEVRHAALEAHGDGAAHGSATDPALPHQPPARRCTSVAARWRV